LGIEVLENIEAEDEAKRRKEKRATPKAEHTTLLASGIKFEPPEQSHESGDDMYQQAWALFVVAQIFLVISHMAAAISLPAYIASFFFWGLTVGRFTRGAKLDYEKNATGKLMAFGIMLSVIFATNIFLPVIALPFWYLLPGMVSGLVGVQLGEKLSLPSKNR
jgi:hypothetical protein